MLTRFRYQAITQSGGRVHGEIEAVNQSAVADELSRVGSYAVTISAIGDDSGKRLERHIGGARLSKGQATVFLRELSMLLKAGMPLDSALQILADEARAKPMKRAAAELRTAIGQGHSFEEALAGNAAVFDPFVISMVAVGEASGSLPAVLETIADARERQQKIKDQLLSAMLYPAFLIVTAIGAVIAMLGLVVPRFKTMIINAGVEMPTEAAFVIGLSDWLTGNASILLIGSLLTVLLIPLASRRPSSARLLDRALLSVPIVGQLLRLNLSIRLCQSLATLVGCGVELPRAIQLIQNMFSTRSLSQSLAESYDTLRQGGDFCIPLARSGLLTPVTISMLRIGQETGELASAAERIAAMLETKFELATRRIFAILEPAIIALVSLFVAGVVLSIIGAVISVNDLVI